MKFFLSIIFPYVLTLLHNFFQCESRRVFYTFSWRVLRTTDPNSRFGFLCISLCLELLMTACRPSAD
jgi:hypothetical protein